MIEENFDDAREGDYPFHGFRGDDDPSRASDLPAAVTVAISRETGARGANIAKRVGDRLGWQVYTQELLEYIAQEGTFRQELANNLNPVAQTWVEDRFQELLKEQNLSRNPSVLEMARIILSLGSQGDVVLLGRGAGYLLPGRTTLHVRLVAPREDRIAYTSQCLRLTEEEAAEQVKKRDARRSEFLATHFHKNSSDPHAYDMVLNTSLLGEDLSAELIARAAEAKRKTMNVPEGLTK